MLVLTRKANEAIQLGDEISITVVSIEGDRVKIGIDAPRSMRIFRKELIVETMNLNKEAARVAAAGVGPGFMKNRQDFDKDAKDSEKADDINDCKP